MGGRYYVARGRTSGEQLGAMARLYPGFRFTWNRNTLRWVGVLTPTPLSASYRIEIRYKAPLHPVVTVLEPRIAPRPDGAPIPHVYPGGHLCLYHPGKWEWTTADLIAETIVPWTSLWLLYYEAWQATGVWSGGGEHPAGAKRLDDGARAPEPANAPATPPSHR